VVLVSVTIRLVTVLAMLGLRVRATLLIAITVRAVRAEVVGKRSGRHEYEQRRKCYAEQKRRQWSDFSQRLGPFSCLSCKR
jgi:hypothetical protein